MHFYCNRQVQQSKPRMRVSTRCQGRIVEEIFFPKRMTNVKVFSVIFSDGKMPEENHRKLKQSMCISEMISQFYMIKHESI